MPRAALAFRRQKGCCGKICVNFAHSPDPPPPLIQQYISLPFGSAVVQGGLAGGAVAACVCLKGSVASLLYVLFAYEIRYSESCHCFWGNPCSPLPCQDLCIAISADIYVFSIRFYFLFMSLPDVFMLFAALRGLPSPSAVKAKAACKGCLQGVHM